MPVLPQQPQSDPARLLPIVTRAFAELGYRRATTAELAKRCGVRENILYRAWPSKKDMFVAAIDYVFQASLDVWQRVAANAPSPGQAALNILDYESVHHGEFGRYRIIFVALSETEDPDIRAALGHMYQRFHEFIATQVRATPRDPGLPDADQIAWALVGLGTVSNIARELELLSDGQRGRLFKQIGQLFLRPAIKKG